MRPKELFAKYGRPPLGNNIPPFADTVNVTAVLIYPLSAGWSHDPSGFRHGRHVIRVVSSSGLTNRRP